MTIMQLQYFTALAELKNYTRAASACFTSQPNISRQIKAMERELDMQLFLRDKRHVALTAEGEAMYRCCRQILEIYQKTLDSIRENISSIPFTLGSMNGFYDISESVRKLYASGRYPNMRIRNAGEFQFRNGETDICFLLAENINDPCFRNVFRKYPKLLIPREKVPDGVSAVTLEQLEEIGVSLPAEGFESLAVLIEKNGYHGRIHRFEYQMYDYDSYLMELRISGCAGFLVNDSFDRFQDEFLLTRVPLPDFYIPVGIIWNPDKDNICRKCAQDLIRLIRADCR